VRKYGRILTRRPGGGGEKDVRGKSTPFFERARCLRGALHRRGEVVGEVGGGDIKKALRVERAHLGGGGDVVC
jgi:hypothetical protein